MPLDTRENTHSHVKPVSITEQMQHSYLDYAMSVIVSRALPDVRDGLKPVQRRIMYTMHEMNNYHDKPHKKSARIVGDVIGKYHPHGDSPIYGALVRMAQEFSLRDPLVDGQGNFGSVDGDAPAQMRYTEVRLAKISTPMLADIELSTVDFQDNYDGTEREPKVLPTRFPNLLVNGANGIAVGMATNIPTHNLGEVIDACAEYIKNPGITVEELVQHLPGPDFPTGGIIMGSQRARNALMTGRGSVIIRSRTSIEELGGKGAIIIHEIPYQVNKAELVEKISDLAKEKVVDGITEIRDESNKLGIRVVIELRRDAHPEVILNQLFKLTELQSSFAYNMLAIDRGRPVQMNARDVIHSFIEFRHEVITRRTNHLLHKTRERAHTLIGLSLAVANIDEVIALIKAAPDPQSAKEALMQRSWNAATVIPLLKLVDDYRNSLDGDKCSFTEEQAKAILEMRLQRLTALEKDKIAKELEELAGNINEYLSILGSRERVMEITLSELLEVKAKHATPRRTEIQDLDHEVNTEDLIQKEEMVVTTTVEGYIKRVPLSTYRAQKRGGKGRMAASMHSDDVLRDVIVTNTHASLLFFTDLGKVYQSKVYKLPVGSPSTKGRALINLLALEQHEKVTTIMPLPEDKSVWDQMSMMFVTTSGNVRRNAMTAFTHINTNGKIAMRLDEGDKLVSVLPCTEDEHVMLASRLGKAIRFPVPEVRIFASRTSDGIRGIKLANKDSVVEMTILKGSEMEIEKRDAFLKIDETLRMEIAISDNDEKSQQLAAKMANELLSSEEIIVFAQKEEFILTITTAGYGKRTSAYEYRITGRGGQGVVNIETGDRNGEVVTSMPVRDDDEIIVMTNQGTLIRTSVNDIRITGRGAKGVKIIDLKPGESVISVTLVENLGAEE
ncbi:MAG: DNA gyrase subunit A [Proteobacteria bacterium]|nr:DNA gyrase subunit A [Pseudomonadota bacterium]